jgi:hypothetical protein
MALWNIPVSGNTGRLTEDRDVVRIPAEAKPTDRELGMGIPRNRS